MQNSPELDFSQILDQSLYTYMADNRMEEYAQKPQVDTPGQRGATWPSSGRLGLVTRLWPILLLIGISKVIIGVVLLILVVSLASDYDKLYATEDTKMVSLMSFGGLLTIVVSGMMLLTSLLLDKKKVMWYYILIATGLCVYIFVLSVMKIHFALLVLERDTYKIILPENKQFLLSTACVLGIITMLASVVHFISNVTVITYYNLMYVQPILLGP